MSGLGKLNSCKKSKYCLKYHMLFNHWIPKIIPIDKVYLLADISLVQTLLYTKLEHSAQTRDIWQAMYANHSYEIKGIFLKDIWRADRSTLTKQSIRVENTISGHDR